MTSYYGKRVLIVSSSDKCFDFFERNIDSSCLTETVFSGADAQKLLNEKEYDVVIINAPLKDQFGDELAENIVKDTCAGVILLVKSEIFDQVSFSMGKIGVLCLSKPISSQMFTQGISLAFAVRERLKNTARKTESLKEKMEEIKLISRAKLLLITKLSFTEEEAHKYIEKPAMDRCVKRSVIAYDIIKTYNN